MVVTLNKTADRILKIINAEKEEILRKYNESTKKNEQEKLISSIQTLDMISNKISYIYQFESSDNILEILRENYEKHDVILRFVDGTEFTIPGKWDHLVSVDEYTICIHEKSKDKTTIPPILKLFNIDNLIEIKRAD